MPDRNENSLKWQSHLVTTLQIFNFNAADFTFFLQYFSNGGMPHELDLGIIKCLLLHDL